MEQYAQNPVFLISVSLGDSPILIENLGAADNIPINNFTKCYTLPGHPFWRIHHHSFVIIKVYASTSIFVL